MYIYDGNKQDTTDKVSDKYIEINSIGLQGSSKTRTVRANGRRDYTLLHLEKGTLFVTAYEKAIVVEKSGFILYQPSMPQDYYIGENSVCYWIHFSGKAAKDLLCDAGLSDILYHSSEKSTEEITRLFKKTVFDFSLENPIRSSILTADITAIISAIGRSIDNGNVASSERLAPIIIKMNRDFAKNCDINFYAEMCGISKSRFLHIFKNTTGISPYAYITRLRLNRAAELLLSSSLSVSEIAYEAGFNDPLNFSKIFKRHYGVSPENFRQ